MLGETENTTVMSRGFVKEDDQEEVPLVPPRAPLPAGATNYVTPNGMTELEREKEEMVAERDSIPAGTLEKERRITTNFLNAKLRLLEERISTAVVVDFGEQEQDKVRFGATVTLKIGSDKKEHRYQIVGVDEAKISEGKISFTSPIAKALNNKAAGEKVPIKLPAGERIFELVAVSYPKPQ